MLADATDAWTRDRILRCWLFRWMEVNLPGGTYLRESTYGFSVLLTVHVVAMCLFLGLIIMMDLRLVGARQPAHAAGRDSEAPASVADGRLRLIVVTGVLLFYSKPLCYYGKGFFWRKMGADGAGRASTPASSIWSRTARRRGGTAAARSSRARMSLVLWAAVLVTGPADRLRVVDHGVLSGDF